MMRLRYGDNFAGSTQAVAYGEKIKIGDVTIQFNPAGHVLARPRSRVSCKDTRIVASGDYKDAPDPTCAPFELVPCDVFHHRGHVWPAGVSSRQCRGRDQEAVGFGGAVSGAGRIWSAPIRWARRSA